MKGHFVVQKSRRQFSLMAKDQSHEQSNMILQTNGGAAGLYEIHEALMLMPQRLVATKGLPSGPTTFMKDDISFQNVACMLRPSS